LSERAEPLARAAYACFVPIQTRWSDNDVYGHVNNVVYYQWFDTVVNRWLIEQGVLDPHHGESVGLVVHTRCDYFGELAFPQAVEAGLRVLRLGTSSVRYQIGIFAVGAADAAAQGEFVHVNVDRASRRPLPLPAKLRAALEQIVR
jgi:acyl-CoA thioester hydrolase